MKLILNRLDRHKRETLKRLSKRTEKSRIYSIKASDLVKINSCPLCGSSHLEPIAQVFLREKLNFFTTSTCTHCLFTFRSVFPGIKWFEKCWKRINTGKLEVFSPKVEASRATRYRKYIALIKKYKSKGRLLEVGAAYGTGAKLLRSAGFDVSVVEPEISKRNFIRKKLKIPVVSSSIENYVSASRKKFDVILFAQCLEHVDHPSMVIRKLGQLLNPGGIVYLEIPIIWLYVNWSDALFLAHKSNFSEDNIQDLVQHGGFNILKSFYFKYSDDIARDYGLMLQYEPKAAKKPQKYRPSRGKSLDDVRSLYRHKLPLAGLPKQIKLLRYSVPHIEQFFQILRLDSWAMKKPQSLKDFITFEKPPSKAK